MIDGRAGRVLIVDDDASIRHMLAATLKKDGYQTAVACDGREALEIMRAGAVDLVLLDLMMPNVTGWEVLSVRAAAPELRKIAVIVITAVGDSTFATIPRDTLCALLPKPFDLDALRALVESCLIRAASAA